MPNVISKISKNELIMKHITCLMSMELVGGVVKKHLNVAITAYRGREL